MKELTEEILLKASKNSPNETKVLFLNKLNLGKFGNKIISKVELIDLSLNELQTISGLFQQFPSVWWINLAYNELIDEFSFPIPYSLGLLEMRGSLIKSLDTFNLLSNTLILRLNVDLKTKLNGNITREQLFQKLHNIWVLNDDFIKHDELVHISSFYNNSIVTDNLNDPMLNHYNHSDTFNPKVPTERENDLMEISTKLIPSKKQFSEYYRLDLVCDDYYQQVQLYNSHFDVVNGICKKMPTINCTNLLYIPHRVRLDMTVLLTASILFPVPKSLFIETMETLLIKYLTINEIHDMIELPPFVKTGIISISRRICTRELNELDVNGFISTKPIIPNLQKEPQILQPQDILSFTPIPSSNTSLPIRDSNGFRYLSFIRNFLNSPLQSNSPISKDSPHGFIFTEMELDLLKFLPDIPTISTCPLPSSAAYRDWVSLTARHTIILMSRSPNCPSLTRSQRSTGHEIILKQLKPLLIAAGMTYEDLEITTTGPDIDGRTISTSNVLSFGLGVPNGKPSTLTWNVNGVTRSYQKPWIPSKEKKELTSEHQNIVEINERESSKFTTSLVHSGENDDLVSIGDSFFSSNDSDVDADGDVDADIDGELSYPLTSTSLKYVTKAEVKSKSHTDTDSEGSLRSRESIFESLRKQNSQQFSTGISDIAKGLNAGLGLGLRPWDSRSLAKSLNNESSPVTVSGFSADSLDVPFFVLGSEKNMKGSPNSEWNEISKPPVILHPLSKVPLVHQKEMDSSLLASSSLFQQQDLPPIQEEELHNDKTTQQVHLNELNLQRLPTSKINSRSNSILSTNRNMQGNSGRLTSRRNSLERMDSASSVGSWKTISRNESGVISRCDSTNSSNGINLQNMSPLERKMMKKHILALKQHRDETQKWLRGFQTNLQESFHSGPEDIDIKTFFMALDESEERLIAKAQELASHDSSDLDYSYSISDSPSHDPDDSVSSNHTYIGKPTKDLKESLLRDMGTLRNISQLNQINKKTTQWIKEQKKIDEIRRNRRGFRSMNKSLSSPYSLHSTMSEINKKNTSPLPLPTLSWSSFVKNPEKTEHNETMKSQDVFITESDLTMSLTPSIGNDEPERLEPVSENDIVSLPKDSTSPVSKKDLHTTEWDPTIPLTHQLRQKIHYDQIYTLPDIEWGHIGTSGKLTATWYPQPKKVVYTLDVNAPIDVARNEILSKTIESPSFKKETQNNSSSYDNNVSIRKIPIQPTVYRNKALIPVEKIYYESIGNSRIVLDRYQKTNSDYEIKNLEELSHHSVLSHTVNLSPQQTVYDEGNQVDIDLESVMDEKVSSDDVRNALTRAENDEFRKADDGTEILPAGMYSRLNTPLVTLSPTHGRTPNINSIEQLLSELPSGPNTQLPPVLMTGVQRNKDSESRSKPLVVRIDPNDSFFKRGNPEKVSVFKPATTKLKLNKNFKQTIPKSYREMLSQQR